ncbi:MAG: glutaminyl-tRNA synthase (glutamine-hydrolyzing) subunit A [Elusimicrobia bacterium CG1_02_63_36]|nr:MAG: glutaminyl-tRNA synthase (glutamine-hydrolyzing) subunit A [Elusimicrobia bacterium CG1_02_63_36]PIP82100.1 MAG: Asp-tRNA(Asn)/Glu-tRNA(Gln) amidotransferase GatCAB subunit A [Elusimicrobia bacterium CG22_combo_CG10-13_8_21_14_all_63_91]PJA15849.1 MAG: Asp-tRNA(Asn)/Glu-tRNA(Gln) amidotransferase GatCAB subunit A [Elusimicrobia bacterium CG_4_10_14_0_2_um_filter_63_34]PJB24837.1 MAG: Asp-tRNA(Asn)/Glu-tRNA(Gln) amidotransferase GatCAB subunit A [Elusimicrobia bacterium CG_4_9_14_3_um_fil
MTEPMRGPASEISGRVRAGLEKAEDAVAGCLSRIEAQNGALNMFLSVDAEGALEAARAIDRRVAAGEDPGPLAGVPVALKDNLHAKGLPTTCGSKILGGYRAPYDADAVSRLRRAGAVIVGKTNLDEFAMGSSTENSAFGPTRNPWNPARVPGGSSGGSAAAVAAGCVPLALGSDTGGSIRQPAAFCGVVGLKPGYGSVSRYGLTAFASSLDQIGPLAASVDDAELCWRAIAGHDPKDSTSSPERPSAPSKESVAGMRIGLPREYFQEGLSPGVEAAVRDAVAALERAGAELREVSLPHTRYSLSVYYLIAPCEASSNLARFDGVRFGHRSGAAGTLDELYARTRGEGFGPEVKRRVMLGTYALSAGYYDAFYRKAQRVRSLIRGDFDAVFESVDLIATPTAPTTAFAFGEKTRDPLSMYLSDIYTLACNLAGHCGISVPCGLSDGLPVGIQFMAPLHRETSLFRAGRVIESWRPPARCPEPAS